MELKKKGVDVLRDATLTRSVEFTHAERQALGLRGLLPYSVATHQQQLERVMESLRRKQNDIERYILLNALQDRNERLFYSVIIEHIEEIMPLIYTPTVGEACKEFSHIFRQTKGFYITPDDKGEIRELLDNWPEKDIRVIVVTDGQRILGLGDLGANGMGIPIGKVALYTATAGIDPRHCLPVMLDVGTDNEDLLNDVLYLGYPKKRMPQGLYFELIEEFVQAIQQKYPNALIQFEDFSTPNAYALLEKYRENILSFNDDIQGTAAVALAGVYASTRITGSQFKDLRVLFLGAGSAATGIADLMVSAFQEAGLSKEEAYRRTWFVDSKGLIVNGRKNLKPHNLRYAHDHAEMSFMEALGAIMPNILIGATGSPGTFDQQVIEKMTAMNERPVIFALSNPTSRAECTAEEAYTWSKGKAVFTSGSPFDKVYYEGKEFLPGQGNNAYIYPGIGLGAIASNTRIITDAMFLIAARTLADNVQEKDISRGSLFPRLTEIRNLSLAVAVAVAEEAYRTGTARTEKPADVKTYIQGMMYDPTTVDPQAE
ncbi:MAG: NAD-dependent malic enzyme [Flavobacteriales bacterium]|nr:NAD-dependent malic enzyme [Flavobacteriales bacterium]MBK6943749.1 NAD-dependent malic enzyme [Flavobacteriales bacterium]MBK7239961.1 NAD-dependent malic enzyme [Flavobacteriales bacterium]MBK9535719.1 NAD-dependent malic enzyme [Flavobacteriales bacterium]MBP9138069.1 NAD-dependent malic enzyme [Flavobacteriales bacterium]